SVNDLIEQNRGEIAAVFIEPVAGNMGCVSAYTEFLRRLRDVCTAEGILLIFDEVMSGFRVARGGAQELYGIAPDLTTFGKIIGGGLPVGAYGGRSEIMEMIAPAGPVYQAGTLSGNPLAMTAGIETLRAIDADRLFYEKLGESCEYLYNGIRGNLTKLGLNYTLNTCGSMFTLFFTCDAVMDFDSAKTSDKTAFTAYFNRTLENGIYLPPSQFEACFVSAAHSREDLDTTIKANYDALKP
ncbi:MAG TPA: aminotransferase class III-fold pyridoxal phosphate-dependent enzyme, partial [Pyrinomonadaceae bacterium]|nr:aminotransferase class III-fold pyridoxal phosphate-dependent enzyme [Pyrinomonadaceae bacterium]